jgi:hypothetical protein
MSTQLLFAGCGLSLMGVIVAIAGMIGIQPALRSLRWHPVEGMITIQPSPGAEERIRYRYSAGGRQFSGSRIAFSAPFTPAPSGSSRYKDGQPVTVYYDPAAPDRSVLEPGPGMFGYLPVGVGGLLFIIGLLLGVMAYAVH